MKEKIIEILKTYQIETSRGTMAVALFTEEEYANLASDINNTFDEVFNQEVEKRIAERMPSDEEINKQAEQAMQRDTKDGRIGIIIDSTYYGVFCDALEWLRSCLTCSEKPNNSQKTEGGAK